MFTYDEKKFFAPVHDKPICHEKPRYSLPEQVEYTSRELRHTLDRLMHFEKAITDKYNELMSNMTQDNVLFKDLMEKAWEDFTSAVRTEINLFETNSDAVVALFKNTVNERLAEFNESHMNAYDDYKAEMNDLINDAVAYMKTNLNTEVETLLRDMEENGSLVGVIDSDVVTTVEKYGAVGDGTTNDKTAFQNAVNAAFTISLKPNKTYVIDDSITLHSNLTINGNGATVKFTGDKAVSGFIANGCENLHIYDLNIVSERSTYAFTTNSNSAYYSKDIIVNNVHLECNNTTKNSGMFFGNVKDLIVENCKFVGKTGANGVETECAVIVWSDESFNTNSKYITLRGNRVEGFYRGFNMHGTGVGSAGNRQLVTIENNIFEGCKNEAVYAYHSPGSKIINNFILGCGKGIFADSSSDKDHDNYVANNSKTNLVSGNTINTCNIGIYTEELESGIITDNILYKCGTGIVIGGGSNYVKVISNSFNECGNGVTLDTGFTANTYAIVAPEIENNTFVKTNAHCIHCTNAASAVIKNNVFRLWGVAGNEPHASAIRIENAAGLKYIIGNEFTNRVVNTTDETKGTPYACISDVNCETYADLHICENSFVNALAEKDIDIVNYSARRYFMNNRFDKDPVVSIQKGYETYYCEKGNNGIEDSVKTV